MLSGAQETQPLLVRISRINSSNAEENLKQRDSFASKPEWHKDIIRGIRHLGVSRVRYRFQQHASFMIIHLWSNKDSKKQLGLRFMSSSQRTLHVCVGLRPRMRRVRATARLTWVCSQGQSGQFLCAKDYAESYTWLSGLKADCA